MTIEDWITHVNKFLAFSDQEILENTGKPRCYGFRTGVHRL